ncbi:DUF6286 domain-containing Asp23/Gls24 family envelope stress response protein [Streptomyces reniochalinae]|uniref:Asp23/Gls24 family envelope stress response protein n=1 Tax=Streptomyces reniochalinae TaxID=2250578 RepID=A0A367EBY2_9ACTN|nr:DUF6286 domain-containing Asp23/Gls24 family envelope stress response protein [Streptomyces reniochalinae]RCG15299.1 Asp23/Gls24 family envelope stress response protein [Streptomyces reniochalinae]
MIEPGRRGSTTVADRAVRRIAQRAATEALPKGQVEVTDTSASVQGQRTHVAVDVTLPYPTALEETGTRVQQHLTHRTARLTGLTVTKAQVRVGSLASQSAADRLTRRPADAPAEPPTAPQRRARRPWSQRRVPMALLILLGLLACAVLLADVVSVHTSDRPPSPWRRNVVEWLSSHGPGDASVAVGGAVAAVAGLWLAWLALTPGLRRLLPVSPPGQGARVTLERPSVATLVRDAVFAVEGVARVAVRCGRRRVRVHAAVSFGVRDAAREAVRGAAAEALRGCGLARTPRLRVTVRPEPHWRPPGEIPTPDGTPRAPGSSSAPASPGPDLTDEETPPSEDPGMTTTTTLHVAAGSDTETNPARSADGEGDDGKEDTGHEQST